MYHQLFFFVSNLILEHEFYALQELVTLDCSAVGSGRPLHNSTSGRQRSQPGASNLEGSMS